MNTNLDAVITQKLERTAKALEKNNMKAYICENKEEALSVVKSLLTKGETLSTGGSVSLQECGVIDLLKSGDYNYLDRTGLSGEAIEKLYRDCFSADSYLCSSNAVTEDGFLYNVDGNSNRVSAITFGPRQVIMVVGMNKVVRNIDEAAKRVKSIAAPANTKRLSCDTYCQKTGVCIGIDGRISDGCDGARICCNYVISAKQRIKDRIKVILVKEELGF